MISNWILGVSAIIACATFLIWKHREAAIDSDVRNGTLTDIAEFEHRATSLSQTWPKPVCIIAAAVFAIALIAKILSYVAN